MSVITGVLYPLLVTSVAAVSFNAQRNGSLVRQRNGIIGSSLIGQEWTSPTYFHGRPSAVAYQPLPSGGSNRSATDATFLLNAAHLRDSLAACYRVAATSIPSDLYMSSASGIDPHISPASAYLQVDNILAARAWPPSMKDRVRALIDEHTDAPLFGLIGQPTVNVLMLNRAMDQLRMR